MAATELKIEDEYVTEMGSFFYKNANALEDGLVNYLEIMSAVKEDALMKGDTAEAFGAFTEYAEYLRGKIEALGEAAKSVCCSFLDDVDEKDQYLF